MRVVTTMLEELCFSRDVLYTTQEIANFFMLFFKIVARYTKRNNKNFASDKRVIFLYG